YAVKKLLSWKVFYKNHQSEKNCVHFSIAQYHYHHLLFYKRAIQWHGFIAYRKYDFIHYLYGCGNINFHPFQV
ncbi:MAG TPA: hypothetical protein VLS85_06885, partial [Hanamia sp.]|nr:hypothetical protein [Hanamia sp.]